MKLTAINIGVLSLVIGLSSCEGNTDRTRQVRNNTSGLIQVKVSGIDVLDYNTPVYVGQTGVFSIQSQRGGSSFVVDPSMGIAEMTITNESGDTCTKEFTIQENWDIYVKERRRIPSDWQHEYTFTVNEDDF